MAKSLYKLSATGAMQVWTIGGILQDEEILITYGQVDGSLQQQKYKIATNSSGRNMKEQMLLEMRARITRQKAKGYRDTKAEASKFKDQNALNLAKPMLAQRFDKVSGFNWESCWRQHKYDGHRMLVHNTGNELIAYSRNGKVIDTLDHITRHLDIPDGATLDGEVYYHGVPLQTIASWCKREQEDTLKLQYVVYDMVSDEPYETRHEKLDDLLLKGPTEVAPSWQSDRPVTEDLRSSIEQGYEGLILRNPATKYDVGKRSKSLIKVKQTMDDEYIVKDVIPSRDGWGVLVCMTAEGKEFRVSAPGDIPRKHQILRNKWDYIGLWVRVEFFSITKEGKPFHPVAINFRNKLSE